MTHLYLHVQFWKCKSVNRQQHSILTWDWYKKIAVSMDSIILVTKSLKLFYIVITQSLWSLNACLSINDFRINPNNIWLMKWNILSSSLDHLPPVVMTINYSSSFDDCPASDSPTQVITAPDKSYSYGGPVYSWLWKNLRSLQWENSLHKSIFLSTIVAYFTVVQSSWNFAQSMAVILPCSVQIF